MTTRSAIVLDSVLRVMLPLVRLLLRNGVTYPTFVAALKRVFIDAGVTELAATDMPRTDSAVTLLTGIHRRDVRTLTRSAKLAPASAPASLASQVVARWMTDPAFHNRRGAPRALLRGGVKSSFDDLVASVSSDVRPRAVLDELRRLGVVSDDESGVAPALQRLCATAGF